MNAYSQDLRERIVRAVQGGMSRAEAARRFMVNERTVRRYVRHYQGEDAAAPGGEADAGGAGGGDWRGGGSGGSGRRARLVRALRLLPSA